MAESFKRGFFYGTGGAINLELGWIPDRVEIFNYTDGTPFVVGFPSAKVVPFSGGGESDNTDNSEIKAGHTIIGATSGATAVVLAVLTDTGSWEGEDAAGNIIIDADTETGTFASENVYYDGSDGTDDATTTASVEMGYDSDTEIAANTDISAYLGTQGANNKGFTVATGSSTNAKMFVYTAYREARD